MTPQDIYDLGTGKHQVYVKLTRLYDPEPVVIYEGPAVVDLTTRIRTTKAQRSNGQPMHDWDAGLVDLEWAEFGRNDYNEPRAYCPYGAYVVEDYQLEILPSPEVTQ